MKSIRKMVEATFGDGTAEQPQIEDVPVSDPNVPDVICLDDTKPNTTIHIDSTTSANLSIKTEPISTTKCESFNESLFEMSCIRDSTLVGMQNPVELSILMDDSEYQDIPGVVRKTANKENVMSSTLLDMEFKRPDTPDQSIIVASAESTTVINNNTAIKRVSTIVEESTENSVSTVEASSTVDLTVMKQANNVTTTTQSSLADELSVMRPQYRSIQRNSERTRALREIGEKADNTTNLENSNVSLSADDSKVSSTKYKIVPPRSFKSKIIIRQNCFRNRVTSTENANAAPSNQ